jgi:hypothetical protein
MGDKVCLGMTTRGKLKAYAVAAGPFLAWAVAFAIAHTQAPLYYSNQNQYFLHGLAEAGWGDLDRDWLANTHDPTPVFSAVVDFTYRFLGESVFYVYYFLLLGAYFSCLAAIPTVLPGPPLRGLARFGYLTLLVIVHAAALRLASVYLFGRDYPWYAQTGVANQYVLGPGLQPSAFGVLLIVSVAAFARGRPVLAVLSAAGAAILHPTYLLSAALLTSTYMALLCWAGRWRAAVLLGAGSLCAVLPVVIYSLRMFAPTSPEHFAEAQRILAEVRIPHHADVGQWLDAIAVGQLAWIAVALWLTRGSTLFPVLTLPALAGLVLSLVQVATASHTLALLFPWRVSIILMPVATAVILARLASAAAPWFSRRTVGQRRCLWAGLTGLLGAALVGGVVVSWYGLGYRTDEGELPMMEYVLTHRRPGDNYLLPVRMPLKLPPRGAVSTSFTPPPKAAEGLIPVDLQRFRLVTGAPIYVDYKSVPYKDDEVLEWYRRVRLCQDWYERKDWGNPALVAELAREGVTHVLVPANRAINSDAFEHVYKDNRYCIYRLLTSPAAVRVFYKTIP